MPEGPDVDAVAKLLLARVRASLDGGWNVTDYISSSHPLRRESTAVQALIPDAVARLVERGDLEILYHRVPNSPVRLPAEHALARILTPGCVDRWRDRLNPGRFRMAAAQALELLRTHAGAAWALDPDATMYAALACAAPRSICADVRDATDRALPYTTAYGGETDPVALIATVAAFRNFAGTVEELVDSCVAILAPVPA